MYVLCGVFCPCCAVVCCCWLLLALAAARVHVYCCAAHRHFGVSSSLYTFVRKAPATAAAALLVLTWYSSTIPWYYVAAALIEFCAQRYCLQTTRLGKTMKRSVISPYEIVDNPTERTARARKNATLNTMSSSWTAPLHARHHQQQDAVGIAISFEYSSIAILGVLQYCNI